MKKLLFGVLTFALIITSCVKDDLADLDKKIDDLKTQITALAEKVAGVATLQTGLTAAQAQLTALTTAVAAIPGTDATDALSASLAILTADVNSISTALGTLAIDVVAGTASTQALVTQLIATTAANQTATLARVATAQAALTAAIAVGDSTLAATLTTELAAAALANATAITAAQEALTLDNTDQSTALTLLIQAMSDQLALAQADIAVILANTTFSLTEIAAITGGTTAQVGATLTAGALTPTNATVTYQWKISATAGGTYADIAGATTNKYTPVAGDAGKFIKVTATGTGNYPGTATSTATAAVGAQTPLTGIGVISSPSIVGVGLTAGALTPTGATATYQWKISATAGGTYADIAGATTNKYTPVAGDAGKFIKVTATGTGTYTGEVTSTATSAIAYPVLLTGVAITGTQQVGAILTATPSPAGVTSVTYQWQISDASDGTYADITDATTNKYTLADGDANKYIKVVALGTGDYTGTSVTSAATGKIAAKVSITAIAAITGGTTATVGVQLTAGALTPTGATATYQWESNTGAEGAYVAIANATTNKYTPVAADAGKLIKVTATGTGSYTGTVTSTATAAVVIGK